MGKFDNMTTDDVVELLEGIKSEASFNGLTDPEAYALDLAIDAVKAVPDIEKLLVQIEKLKGYNRLYYQKISEYITTFDKWKESKNNPADHAYYQKACMEIENWMRTERDRVEAILNKKNDPQLKIDM